MAMKEIENYYIYIDENSEEEMDGLNKIAYVSDPAIEAIGLYLSAHHKIQIDTEDKRVISKLIEDEVINYLKKVGTLEKDIPDDWTLIENEPDENDLCPSKDIELDSSRDMLARDGSGMYYVRYKYQGPKDGKNRDFCSKVLSLGRLYTEEEIKMELSNPQFGNYSIWNFKGSYNCRHRWQRVIYFQSFETNRIKRSYIYDPAVTALLVDDQATQVNERVSLSINEKQQVVAPLLIPDKPIYRFDEDSGREYNIIFKREVINSIRNLASKRGTLKSKNLFKNTHKGEIVDAYILEEWIIEDENDKAFTEYGFSLSELPIGTWMVISKINDKKFFDREIKDNDKYAYSIEAFLDIISEKHLKEVNMSLIETPIKVDIKSTQKNKKVNMEETKMSLPDGSYKIEDKVYVVKDGTVVKVIEEGIVDESKVDAEVEEEKENLNTEEETEDLEDTTEEEEELEEDKKEDELENEEEVKELENIEETLEVTDEEDKTELESYKEEMSVKLEELYEEIAELRKLMTEVEEDTKENVEMSKHNTISAIGKMAKKFKKPYNVR